jgi:methyltransferase (TIGR00027 family)
MQEKTLEALFSDVEETGLLTLYGKAIESQSDNPIMDDPVAVAMTKKLDPILARSESKLLRRLYERKIDPRLVVHVTLRAKKYDAYARNFQSRYIDTAIINIGCGLDPRFQRIDNGSVRFFDLDLPEVIRFKQALLKENDRYKMIASNVFDVAWMDEVKKSDAKHWMFMAEGVFMYLQPEMVKKLVLDLQAQFPGSELVCEVVKKSWTHGMMQKMAAMKMKKRFNIGGAAGYHFGLDTPTEMESWQDGIEFLDAWSYFDSNHKRLGMMRIFRKSQYFRETQYTVHYRLR